TEAAHWGHRSGNTMSHELQIIDLVGLNTTTGSEINIQGSGNSISDGDTTPIVTDDTDFGSVDVSSGTSVHTFTIQNIGTTSLTVGAISITGANASDFTITASPSGSVSASGSTTFNVTF
ncbi:MAG: choice-of-anchor D domain-containing protein, partial [Flavobacteriia bacterium]|nr:choice-of-anchor D domain-containing protein [Flavobacteriia bacterium]